MKTYTTENQIRLVGRVWEIRHYLKMAQQRLTTDVRLLQFLAEQTGHQSELQQKGRGLWLDGEASFGNTPSSAPSSQPSAADYKQDFTGLSSTATPHRPLLPSQLNRPYPRVLPFPSKEWAQGTLPTLGPTLQP